MSRLERTAVVLLMLLWGGATLVMLVHNLRANPQLDTQLLTFAFQFLRDLSEGNIADAFLAMRKYPLLPVVLLAVLEAKVILGFLIAGRIDSIMQVPALVFTSPDLFHLTARILILVAALATIVLTARCARRLWPHISPPYSVVLLFGSIVLLTFATSVRPHVLVTAMTMLTFLASIRLVERPTHARELCAFAAAGLTFATLQSGLFAFLFPVFGSLAAHRGRWASALPRLIVLCVGGLLLALLLGYTHALGFLFGRSVEYGLGLGNTDMNDQPWNGVGYLQLLDLLVWSEPVITIAAIIGTVLCLRRRRTVHPMVWAALIYVVIFGFLFGLNGNTPPRFFLPILPFLALLGAPAIARFRSIFWLGICLGVVVTVRFTALGLRPDTYQSAAAFLQAQTSGPIVSQVPPYFLGIPPARAGIEEPRTERERFILSLQHDLPGARVFLPQERWREASSFVAYAWSVPSEVASSWRLCAEFPSVRGSDSVFLWGEVPQALPRLLTAKALGPWLEIYCRPNVSS